jgi:hypothetical protein
MACAALSPGGMNGTNPKASPRQSRLKLRQLCVPNNGNAIRLRERGPPVFLDRIVSKKHLSPSAYPMYLQ